MSKNKHIDLEIMRILACYFVIFNHTGNNGYFLFSKYGSNTITFWIYMFISVFCLFAVKLFFMVSGALFLIREPDDIAYLWKHRIAKMLIILTFWSLFYYIVECWHGGRLEFDIKEFLIKLYDRNLNFSFWYLYKYIALLISLPILQRIAKSLQSKEYIYMIILYIGFYAILPIVQYLLWQDRHNLNGNLRVSWLTQEIFMFPLLGYFIRYRVNDYWNNKRLIILWCSNIVAICLTCYMTYYQSCITGICDEEHSQGFFGLLTIINSMTVFVTCQYFCGRVRINKNIHKVIVSIASNTFGIYLIHVFVMNKISVVKSAWDLFREKLNLNYMISALLFCLFVLVVSYFLVCILKKIPVLCKFI